jgi:hypothetical protein
MKSSECKHSHILGNVLEIDGDSLSLLALVRDVLIIQKLNSSCGGKKRGKIELNPQNTCITPCQLHDDPNLIQSL